MKKIKIGLITTLNTNLGDDLIRKGIINLIESIYSGYEIEYVMVNKHNPYTVYPFSHPVFLLNYIGEYFKTNFLKNLRDKITKFGFSKFDKCDIIIQCGAPVLWPDCNENEWAIPLWEQIIGRLYLKKFVFNIAAGSCYPMENQPQFVQQENAKKYLKRIYDYCRLTTVRDSLSKKLFESIHCSETILLPCTAFLSAKNEKIINENGYILINYMEGGGHYDWDQKIDNKKWERTIKDFIDKYKNKNKIAFLCHDKKEYELAKKLAPELPVILPESTDNYFNELFDCKFAICNRMHASVALASIGIPSIAICTDTRLLMVKEIGLPVYYIKDADFDTLEKEVINLSKNLKKENERLIELKKNTFTSYFELLTKYLPKI